MPSTSTDILSSSGKAICFLCDDQKLFSCFLNISGSHNIPIVVSQLNIIKFKIVSKTKVLEIICPIQFKERTLGRVLWSQEVKRAVPTK